MVLFFVGGNAEYVTFAKRSACHLPVAIQEVREVVVQHLPRRTGAWALLVCLLARGVAPALWLHRESCPYCRRQPASCPGHNLSCRELTVLHLMTWEKYQSFYSFTLEMTPLLFLV